MALVSGSNQVLAHRAVLAAASPYFEETFTAKNSTNSLVFPDIEERELKLCVEFIYSGSIGISENNAEKLLKASMSLKLNDLILLCLEYLAERLNVNNCANVIAVCHKYNCDAVDNMVRRFLCAQFDNFFSVDTNSPFTFDEFFYCLSLLRFGDRDLEMKKWKAVLLWVNCDLTKRKSEFTKLFATVDVSVLSKDFINTSLLGEPLVRSCCESLSGISAALANRDWPITAKRRKSMSHIIACKRESQVILKYDIVAKKWSNAGRFPGRFSDHCDIITHLGNIYVGTGEEIHEYANGKWNSTMFRSEITCTKCQTVFRYVGSDRDVFTFANSFWTLNSLQPQKVNIHSQVINCAKCRCHFSYNSPTDCADLWYIASTASCYNRCIGISNVVYMVTKHSVFEYCVDTKELSCHRADSNLGDGFFATSSNEKIYALGGVGSEQSVYEYDIKKNRSLRVSDMLQGKSRGHSVWYGDKVFAFGQPYPSTVECYDPGMDTWTVVPSLTILIEPGNVFVGDMLYLIGGNFKGNYETISLKKLKPFKKRQDKLDALCFPGDFTESSQ